MNVTALTVSDVSAEPEVVTTDERLAGDAEFIRRQIAGIERGVLAIADRLREVHDREGWTVRQLAEWCVAEQLPLGSKSRVAQLLQYAVAVEVLTATGALSTTVDKPTEWNLRPLAKAIGRGMTPEDAAKVWTEAVECYDDPKQWHVDEMVEAKLGRATVAIFCGPDDEEKDAEFEAAIEAALAENPLEVKQTAVKSIVSGACLYCSSCDELVFDTEVHYEPVYLCSQCAYDPDIDGYTRAESNEGDSTRCPTCNRFGSRAEKDRAECPKCQADLLMVDDSVRQRIELLTNYVTNAIRNTTGERGDWSLIEEDTFTKLVAATSPDTRRHLVDMLRVAEKRVLQIIDLIEAAD
jgi:ssDNA-binding Zn-finger/Zn-ribbon topoisomerase 1